MIPRHEDDIEDTVEAEEERVDRAIPIVITAVVLCIAIGIYNTVDGLLRWWLHL